MRLGGRPNWMTVPGRSRSSRVTPSASSGAPNSHKASHARVVLSSVLSIQTSRSPVDRGTPWTAIACAPTTRKRTPARCRPMSRSRKSSFNRKSRRRTGEPHEPASDRAGSREWGDPRASRHLGPRATSSRGAGPPSSSPTSRGPARRPVETCVPATALGRHVVPHGPNPRDPSESRRAPETVHGIPRTCCMGGLNAGDIVLPHTDRDTLRSQQPTCGVRSCIGRIVSRCTGVEGGCPALSPLALREGPRSRTLPVARSPGTRCRGKCEASAAVRRRPSRKSRTASGDRSASRMSTPSRLRLMPPEPPPGASCC